MISQSRAKESRRLLQTDEGLRHSPRRLQKAQTMFLAKTLVSKETKKAEKKENLIGVTNSAAAHNRKAHSVYL